MYDIDILINRTLVFGTLTVLLALVYAGSVLFLQFLLSGFTGGNALASVASTLASAALFQPLRQGIQNVIDRRYTDADLLRLQQILALKFLGFSLEEIKHCLQIGPTVLQESLSLQKAMMQEKRTQLDNIIQAIEETEQLLPRRNQRF